MKKMHVISIILLLCSGLMFADIQAMDPAQMRKKKQEEAITRAKRHERRAAKSAATATAASSDDARAALSGARPVRRTTRSAAASSSGSVASSNRTPALALAAAAAAGAVTAHTDLRDMNTRADSRKRLRPSKGLKARAGQGPAKYRGKEAVPKKPEVTPESGDAGAPDPAGDDTKRGAGAPHSVVTRRGIRNVTGTLCYMSSVLHCLASLGVVSYSNAESPLFLRSINEMISLVRAGTPIDDAFIRRCFELQATAIFPVRGNKGQQDAQEFLARLIDASTTRRFFEIDLQSKLRCSIGHERINRERFGDEKTANKDMLTMLALDFPTEEKDEEKPVSLSGLIEKFLKPEDLSDTNSVRCDMCMKAVPTTKQLFLDNANPEYLIIHLKRFSSTGATTSKNSTPVVITPQITVGKGTYNLSGIVNHRGSLRNGHYTADTKLPDGSWVHCDDSAVRSDESGPIAGSTPYILFYTRAKDGEAASLPRYITAQPKTKAKQKVKKGKARDTGKPDETGTGKTGKEDASALSLALTTQKKSKLFTKLPDALFGDVIKYLSFVPQVSGMSDLAGMRTSCRSGKHVTDSCMDRIIKNNLLEAYRIRFGFALEDPGAGVRSVDQLPQMHGQAISLHLNRVAFEYCLPAIIFSKYLFLLTKAKTAEDFEGFRYFLNVFFSRRPLDLGYDYDDMYREEAVIEYLLRVVEIFSPENNSLENHIKGGLKIVCDDLIARMTIEGMDDKERARVGILVNSAHGLIQSVLMHLFCNEDFTSLVKLLIDDKKDSKESKEFSEATYNSILDFFIKSRARANAVAADLRFLAMRRIPDLCIQAIKSGNAALVDEVLAVFGEKKSLMQELLLGYVRRCEVSVDKFSKELTEEQKRVSEFLRKLVIDVITANPNSIAPGCLYPGENMLLFGGLLKDPVTAKLLGVKLYRDFFEVAAVEIDNAELTQLCLDCLPVYCQNLDDLDDEIIDFFEHWHWLLRIGFSERASTPSDNESDDDEKPLEAPAVRARRLTVFAKALKVLFMYGEAFVLGEFLTDRAFTKEQLIAMHNAVMKRVESDKKNKEGVNKDDFIDIEKEFRQRIALLGKNKQEKSRKR